MTVRLGLQIPDFTWPGGPPQLGATLARIARDADQAGYESLWVMDHFFQIGAIGPPEREMLEAYTTLCYLAAVTSRVRLGTLVTGTHYRHPGILVKEVTTLDVLSGGRGILGIGAGWNEQESLGLGVPFPTVSERFEQLEETLQIAIRMWAGDESPFQGTHFRLERPLNSPQALSKPHPPIVIGGGGERKTLRLVARYADGCNFFGGAATAQHKLEVLREHCEREGRDFGTIAKTIYYPMDVGKEGTNVGRAVEDLGQLAAAGIDAAIGSLANVADPSAIAIVAERVMPQIAAL
jgi:F420-dependent oxidoreductase-like protein